MSREDALLWTIDSAASALSISTRSVESLISQCELGSVRIGRCRRIPRAAVEAYVARLVAEQAGGEVEPLAPEARRLVQLARPVTRKTVEPASLPVDGLNGQEVHGRVSGAPS